MNQVPNDIQSCLVKLEKHGRLAIVESEVDIVHELAGIAKKLEGGRTLLFQKLKGYDFSSVIGLFWNRENLATLYNCNVQELPFFIANAVKTWQSNPIEPVLINKAPVQEVVQKKPDLNSLPIPILALEDGGPYLSCSVIMAKDPDTGVRNISVHRCMVTGRDRLTTLLDMGRHLRDYYERAEAKGKPLEITISNGVDPSVYFAAITPSAAAPIDTDELGIASALLGAPVELSSSQTVDVEGIANAQFVIEGEMLPKIRETEGPFAEVTGYYATKSDRWVIHVKAITHRAKPVFHSLLPGREVFNSVGLTGEANIYHSMVKQVPGVTAVHLGHSGCGFFHAIVQMEPKVSGMAKNAILSAFAAFPPLQMVTIVNSDVDINQPEEILWAMATRCRADEDIVIIPKIRGHELNPSTDKGIGAKMGFDCTIPVDKPDAYKRIKMMDVDIENYKIKLSR